MAADGYDENGNEVWDDDDDEEEEEEEAVEEDEEGGEERVQVKLSKSDWVHVSNV